MNQQEPFQLETPDGRALRGVVQFPEKEGRRPVVVVCHGFKGFFEWGFFPPLADLLAQRGFVVVRFNFWGTGMKPGDELVTDQGAFRRATFGRDLEDLFTVLEAVGTDVAADRANPARLGLVGHSRGGGTAVLAAAHDAWRERLGAVVTWNAVASYAERYDDATRRKWRQDGVLTIANARTGQELEIGVEVLDELEARASELTALEAAPKVAAPWLVVHGEVDEAVPVSDGHRLHAAATATKALEIVAGGSHTFGAKHPFAGPTAELVQAMNATQTWLKRHLG